MQLISGGWQRWTSSRRLGAGLHGRHAGLHGKNTFKDSILELEAALTCIMYQWHIDYVAKLSFHQPKKFFIFLQSALANEGN